jgi:hypothetical protein
MKPMMLAALVIAMASAAWAQQVCPPLPTGEPVIAEWHGDGKLVTRPFHIDGPWELQWSIKPLPGEPPQNAMFQVFSYHPGSKEPTVLAVGETNSSAYVDQGGDYYLDIHGIGAWTARVVKVTKP